jgi:hypothetical protein
MALQLISLEGSTIENDIDKFLDYGIPLSGVYTYVQRRSYEKSRDSSKYSSSPTSTIDIPSSPPFFLSTGRTSVISKSSVLYSRMADSETPVPPGSVTPPRPPVDSPNLTPEPPSESATEPPPESAPEPPSESAPEPPPTRPPRTRLSEQERWKRAAENRKNREKLLEKQRDIEERDRRIEAENESAAASKGKGKGKAPARGKGKGKAPAKAPRTKKPTQRERMQAIGIKMPKNYKKKQGSK